MAVGLAERCLAEIYGLIGPTGVGAIAAGAAGKKREGGILVWRFVFRVLLSLCIGPQILLPW